MKPFSTITARGLVVGIALAAALFPALAAPPPAEAGTVDDPAKLWEHFLANAEFNDAFTAYDVLDAVGYDTDAVDPGLCAEHAEALDAAVAKVPVSIAIRRAAFLCADATGDEARAEREMAALATLSRHALAQGGELETQRPIPVLSPADANALMASRGLEQRYQYYVNLRPARYFPLVLVGWDEDAKAERHLGFDFVAPTYAIHRTSEYFGFPVLREVLADAFVEGGVANNLVYARDIAAVKAAASEASVAAKLAKLRPAADFGGLQSAKSWLLICGKASLSGCGDGLIDALLPLAEQQQALSMVLLAYAHGDGIGVKRNEGAAWTLLDAADRRWQGAAVVEYADIWRFLHKDQAMPAALQQRLARAQAAGHRSPRRWSIQEKIGADKPSLDAADIAFLAEPAENAGGKGFEWLATYYAKLERKPEHLDWLAKAAAAGDADSQARYGFSLIKGEDVTADKIRGERLMTEAAHGGNWWAMRYLGGMSQMAARWSDAEAWLMAAVIAGDIEAIMSVAEMYEFDRPGLNGNVDTALKAYQSMAAQGDGAEARRRLAAMAMAGRGMEKDASKAVQWLRSDADKADHKSESMLGMIYLSGDLGEVDEAKGMPWIERALAAKEEGTYTDYGSWLYFTKATPESRAKGIELWRQGSAAGSLSATNNLAWALCTSPYPEIFDAKGGLDVAARMGPVEELPGGWVDTVAACHAAAGDFTRAVALQTKAVELMDASEPAPKGDQGEPVTPEYRRRLTLYQAGERYRAGTSD